MAANIYQIIALSTGALYLYGLYHSRNGLIDIGNKMINEGYSTLHVRTAMFISLTIGAPWVMLAGLRELKFQIWKAYAFTILYLAAKLLEGEIIDQIDQQDHD